MSERGYSVRLDHVNGVGSLFLATSNRSDIRIETPWPEKTPDPMRRGDQRDAG